MRKVDGGKRPGGVVACGEDCFFLLFLITSGSPSLTSLTPPSFLGCLSDTVEIIWEERREQQKLSTVIVCINHSACIHSERKKKKSVIRVHSPPSFPFNSEICGDPLPLHTDYRESSSAPCSVHSGYNPKSDLFLLLWLTIILTFESI